MKPNQTSPPFSVGFGYDVHRFEEGRLLYLGGVSIESERGLAGHSDADVLLHALCDALLGAAGLPDIGHLFPDTDPAWKDIRSTELLRRVKAQLDERVWRVGNADISVVAENPRIGPYVQEMKSVIGETLEIPAARIGIKATTNEGMGFIGRGEGIAAMASVLLWR